MKVLLIALLIIFVLIMFFYYENNVLEITPFKIKCNIKNNIRIIHLSDIHSKEFGINNRRLIRKINKLNPDLIFVTGDLINMDGKNTENMINLLINLKFNNIQLLF